MRDIIIVEDGLHERERLEKLFRNANYSVSTAESVQEAEHLLAIEQYRLAVLDIGLGDKSGSYLFELMKRSGRVPYVIIFTGNPSVHLKQRLLDEGAAAYIIKGSAQAANEPFLEQVRALLGGSDREPLSGIPLPDFIRLYLPESSRELFVGIDNKLPACAHCGSDEFVVSFSHKVQLPPLIEGRVVCSVCREEMDPQLG